MALTIMFIVFPGHGGGGKGYHRCKIYYPANGKDSAFFRVDGYKIPLDECIRMGV